MIKKTLMGMSAILAVTLIVIIGFASAQNNGQKFIDADGDGVCDNAGNCPNKGSGLGKGFVDADGDGACDNAGNCPMKGRGCGGAGGCQMRGGARGGCPRLAAQ